MRPAPFDHLDAETVEEATDALARSVPAVVLARAQGRHGALQGQGAALLEELAYDADGRPTATSFAEYPLPLATEIPEIDLFHTETPTPFALNGAKGVGESGVIAAPAAIVNAIQDALPAGAAELTAIPVRPDLILSHLHQGART